MTRTIAGRVAGRVRLTLRARVSQFVEAWGGDLVVSAAGESTVRLARVHELRLAISERLLDASLTPREAAVAVAAALRPGGPAIDSDKVGPAAATLPTGVVSFFLTDVVGSTRLWEAAPHEMVEALARHDAIVRSVVETNGGALLGARGEGDSTFSVFQRATQAVGAGRTLFHQLAEEPWPPHCPIRVRAAIHSGEAFEQGGDYRGPAVNRAARIREMAQADQLLISQATAELVADHIPSDCRLAEEGTWKLRDLQRPETIFRLVGGIAPVPSAIGPGMVPNPRHLAAHHPGRFVKRTVEPDARTDGLMEAALSGGGLEQSGRLQAPF